MENKLIVITFKRPSINLERAIYGSDFSHAYDCEAFSMPEVAESKYNEYINNPEYSDVDKFECSDYEYMEFVKNEEAYVNFTKTGEHSMKPIEGLDEDVAVGVEDINISKIFKYEMLSSDDGGFTFDHIIDDIGQLIVRPININTVFKSAEEVAEISDITPSEDERYKTGYITVEAHILSESNETEVICDIDEIGQLVIAPKNKDDMFVSASIKDSLNLVTEEVTTTFNAEALKKAVQDPKVREQVKNILDGKDDQPEKPEVEAKVIEESIMSEEALAEDDDLDAPHTREEIEREIKEITNNFSIVTDTIKTGFEVEKDYSIDILKQHYEEVDVEQHGDWYHITYDKPILTEAMDPSSEQFANNREMAERVIDDIGRGITDVVKQFEALYRIYRRIGIDADEIRKICIPTVNGLIAENDEINCQILKQRLVDYATQKSEDENE